MTTGASGPVFFLGTRAHYQVLQQPDPRLDAENGNTEIYRNSLAAGDYSGYSVLQDNNVPEDKDRDSLRSRSKRPSEATLADDMKPAQLNNVGNGNGNGNASPKPKSSRRSLLAFLSSLARRKKRLHDLQYLRHVETVLTTCTYRESCRCLDCQSSYFDCDLEEEWCDSSGDDSDDNAYLQYSQYPQYSQQYSQYPSQYAQRPQEDDDEDDDDDEVFVDQVPSDSTSTDILLEPKKMSVSSAGSEDPETMNLEVAAGTPLLLNFLLTHPITCSIQ